MKNIICKFEILEEVTNLLISSMPSIINKDLLEPKGKLTVYIPDSYEINGNCESDKEGYTKYEFPKIININDIGKSLKSLLV